jgi:hypothetical protein
MEERAGNLAADFRARFGQSLLLVVLKVTDLVHSRALAWEDGSCASIVRVMQ